MNWIDYLNLAEDLNKNSTQTNIRSAMSRTYYSIFNLIKEHNKINFIFSDKDKGKVHSSLINHLCNSNKSIENTIGKQLDNLRKRRNVADYNKIDVLSQSEVTIHINTAKHILQLLSKL